MTDPTPRAAVIAFFEDLGAPRVSISRETLSRLTRIAYPTLDPILAGLKADGLLEPHPIMADQWRPTFAFIDKIAAVDDKAQRTARFIEDLKSRERQVAEDRDRRARAIEEANRRRAERAQEIAAIRASRVARRKAEQAARVERAAKTLATTSALKPTVKLVKIKLEPAKPDAEPPAPPAPAPNDPWAIIRARTYGKPPLVASNLRQLTPAELMAGRARKRA